MKNVKIQQIPSNISTKKDIIDFFKKKIDCFQNMIQSTLLVIQKYKTLNIFSAKEFNLCIQGLETIFNNLNNITIIIKKSSYDQEDILNKLQNINNELSQIFRSLVLTTTHNLKSKITLQKVNVFFFNLFLSA